MNPNRPSVVISVPDDFLNDNGFIEKAYSKLFDNKKIFNELFGEPLDIGFLSSNSLNEGLLKEDGFGYIEKY